MANTIDVKFILPDTLGDEQGEYSLEGWHISLLSSDGRKVELSDTDADGKAVVLLNNRTLKRPQVLECDIVRFQNNKDKWIAFVGLLGGRPYEIFTGLANDDDGLLVPKSVSKGRIIKSVDENGNKRYDFQYINTRGYKTTIEGLSYKFDKEFWNYAKLISGVLRYGMPIEQVIKMVSSLELDSESINSWKVGVERALKKYLPQRENSGAEI